MIDYEKLLSAARRRTSTVANNRSILTESESDRGRVLFSPAFRRLQQKAQVFSMEPNAAVRSRLTHSFEVSQIGRYLADEITQRLKGRLDQLQQGALVNFVETACLMHDIGNPPFGHFGEAAIQEWFKTHGEKSVLDSMGMNIGAVGDCKKLLKLALGDFEEFDGNPQGLRIVSRLQWNTDPFGLNLTKTTLASFLKYVRCPIENRSERPFTKKPGYFLSEQDVAREVWEEFGYSEAPQRFPLAYIMEAADDIAYCVSDLEDSFEKGIIQEATAFPEIRNRYVKEGFSSTAPCHNAIIEVLEKMVEASLKNDFSRFTYTDFRTRLNNAIIRYVADRYVEKEKDIETGELKSLLPEDEPPGAILKVLKDFCREKVYRHETVQRVELAGYYAITGLLEQTRPLLSCSRKRFEAALAFGSEDEKGKRILLEPKLLKLFPQRYLKVYEHQVTQYKGLQQEDFLEWNARAHLVVDFISGMTDDFAMTTYRTLAGMRL
ncbi:dGTPase [Delftia acidovorans]|uniref:dGTPase n=1 Tax=Delftia acidovorans TaxID=80866 RepID=UPI000F4CFD2D|nr:dGTPase [Delftia acidovorans]ROR00725.1 dGTPase [Delftia acidovorans]